MKAMTKKAGTVFSVLALIVGTSSCIMEDRIVQFVISNGTCEEFVQYSVAVNFTTTATVDYANEIEEALSDNGVSRDEIVTARVVSASYEVTEFSQAHDWLISGAIMVARTDVAEGPDTLINYTSQPISADALGRVTPANLNRAGVDLVNQALDDFKEGLNPVLEVRVNNGAVSPPPNALDPIQFNWKACMVVHIVTKKDVDVPDPF